MSPDLAPLTPDRARRLLAFRQALRAPLPYGVPGRSLDKTLVLGLWRGGTRFAADPANADIVGAAVQACDVLALEGAGGPALSCWGYADWRGPAPSTGWTLYYDTRRITLGPGFGGEFVDFACGAVSFRLWSAAPAADRERPGGPERHDLALGAAWPERGLVWPEELEVVADGVAFAPARRRIACLAGGRLSGTEPGFGALLWTALEIDFIDEALSAQAAVSGTPGPSALAVEPEGAIMPESTPALPPPGRSKPTGEDFLQALKALFFGESA